MAEHTTKYGILVAVDGSAESDAAVRWAADAAVMHDSLSPWSMLWSRW